jgi:DNA repair exonuclease SbcCD nuclease subunit
MKFAHLSDVHLGSWKQPEMQELNFDSFRKALDIIIKERLDFVLISGDLFDMLILQLKF